MSYSSALLFVTKAFGIIIHVQTGEKLLLTEIPVTSRPKQNVLSYVYLAVHTCGVRHSKHF